MEQTIAKKDLIEIRKGVEGDAPFIMQTMLNGLYYGTDFIKQIEKGAFMGTYHDILERLIYRATTGIHVACLKEDRDVILGYSIFEKEILHYVFVKPVWRRIGLARDLVPTDTLVTTHLTDMGSSIKPSHIGFNPFLIIRSNNV